MPKRVAIKDEAVRVRVHLSSGSVMDAKKPAENPTTIRDSYWVWAKLPAAPQTSDGTYGKWLVFRNFDRLDETWHRIKEAVESGELGATSAKSSTAAAATVGVAQARKGQGVICVYMSKNTIDEVGLKLIYLVRHDIRYKTDEATLRRLYSYKGHQKITCRTIYWNGGDPSFEKVGSTSGPKRARPKKSTGKEATKEYYKKTL